MDDLNLVKKILKGDEQALELFYKNYKNRLFFFVKNRIGNEKDAEEIVTDVFLSAIDNLDHFQNKCSLFSFLCSIAKHKAVDFLRKKKINCLFFSENPILENIISKISLPEEKLEKKILNAKIMKIFALISPKHKKILIQKYIHGLSIKEIAKIGNMSFKQTESLLFRARSSFKIQFARFETYG